MVKIIISPEELIKMKHAKKIIQVFTTSHVYFGFLIVCFIFLLLGCASQTQIKQNVIYIKTQTNNTFFEAYNIIGNLCDTNIYSVSQLSNNGSVIEYECKNNNDNIYIGYNHDKKFVVIKKT
jgi:hypothetical protein